MAEARSAVSEPRVGVVEFEEGKDNVGDFLRAWRKAFFRRFFRTRCFVLIFLARVPVFWGKHLLNHVMTFQSHPVSPGQHQELDLYYSFCQPQIIKYESRI